MPTTQENQQKKQFGTGPAAEVRRWLKELDLADKEEKSWRDCGERIFKRYRGDGRKRNSFNILWSNTETLSPALFNTPPSPDVRRRFRDEDPVGKVVSQVLERCLQFQTDNECFMHAIKNDVLDACLPGRGVSRVKYVPTTVPMETAGPSAAGEDVAEAKEMTDGETPEPDEAVVWEQAELEHVQWDDFRRGPGKTWDQVPWVAFKHRMNREELAALCGDEIANSIPVDDTADETINKDNELKTVFGTVCVWEFWCKDDRKVRYICPGYKAKPLKELDDPLKLIDFFPNPRPLYAIADSASLIPTALFEQYREQADELDRISTRINQLVDACRARGVYDATMKEVEQLMRAGDKQLIPIQDAALWAEKGGLDKAIYWMPIDMMARVLTELYKAREETKQIIYELSGIADVRRGATDPNETLGAQKLKADFGNQRISGLKLEVERYVRDLMRMMSEIVADKFAPDTLLRMSQMQIPTNQQIDAKAQQMIQQIMQQAQAQQQQGQPPAPGQPPGQQAAPPQPMTPQQAMQQLPPRPVSLEQVMEVLHDDATRTFKVDVETDSMVTATATEDMAGLQQVLGGVVQFIQGVGPAVQMGAFPVEAVKAIVMTICRRSKMGTAVEDALDKIKAPSQQGDPNKAKADAAMQAEQMKAQVAQATAQAKMQSDMQTAQIKAESDARIAQIEAQAQQQTDMVRQQAEAAQHQAKIDSDARFEQLKAMLDDEKNNRQQEFMRWKAELDAATKIEVANISSKAKVDDAATQTATNEIASEVQQ